MLWNLEADRRESSNTHHKAFALICQYLELLLKRKALIPMKAVSKAELEKGVAMA